MVLQLILPSGHTATAFAGAEFLGKNIKMFQFGTEFQDVVATGTGFFRMYNDRHWLTDVAAGAGIGILCTKTAYWLYPKCKTTFQKRKQNVSYDCSFITEKKRNWISRTF
jgi:hypothetical protein